MELGTDAESVPNSLGAVDFDLGIIAGSRSINLVLSTLIPGPDDGKVALERTKVSGMNQHLILPVTHPFMMSNRQVIDQTIHYLAEGEFITDSALSN